MTQIQFVWKSKSNTDFYDQQYIDWIGNNVLSQMGDGTSIVGCTEHTRNNCAFCGHPNYHHISSWHNWALFEWGGEEENVAVPGHIVMFLLFENITEPISIDNDRVVVESSGLYALVESLDDGFGLINMNTLIAQTSLKIKKNLSQSLRNHLIQTRKKLTKTKTNQKISKVQANRFTLCHFETIDRPACLSYKVGENY